MIMSCFTLQDVAKEANLWYDVNMEEKLSRLWIVVNKMNNQEIKRWIVPNFLVLTMKKGFLMNHLMNHWLFQIWYIFWFNNMKRILFQTTVQKIPFHQMQNSWRVQLNSFQLNIFITKNFYSHPQHSHQL